MSGLPLLGLPLFVPNLLCAFGDLGEVGGLGEFGPGDFGDFVFTEICNGETENGSAFSEADCVDPWCSFDTKLSPNSITQKLYSVNQSLVQRDKLVYHQFV